ncbi:MAG: hypothetical protein APF80_01655 [Alphaproteobacteria bacterium BRH_c36]|nr:MAG: hypothetical protein APF80_01655 [Alphaproteobacteria bacterium BRH_c36]
MLVIVRNGRRTVYTGWRAWLLMGAMLLIAWLALALIAFAFVGIAITAGIMFLLLVPAFLVVAGLGALMKR